MDVKQKTILLVEDEYLTAMSQKIALQDYGYNVLIAKNGKEAIEIVNDKSTIDLILMDMNLGDHMDGSQTAEIILKDRDIPIVALSNHFENDIVAKMGKISPYGYVVKTSGMSVVNTSIKMALALFNANQQVLKNENIYNEIFNSISDVFKVVELIYDEEGTAIDYFYHNVNSAFEKFINKTRQEILGKRAKEVFGTVEGLWLKIFARVNQTGEPEDYTSYGPDKEESYNMYSWKISENQIGIIFTDYTYKNQLDDELKEKTTLLKEVYHRTKNTISSIEGLLFLQLNAVSNPETVAVLQDSIARINSMRIIYDKLLISENFQNVSVKNYSDNLIDGVLSLFPFDLKITLKKQIDDFNLTSKILFPLGMIINELLTNVMKYSFEDQNSGSINITLTNTDNNVELIIHDNGKGLPEDFDIHNSSGFGLTIVQELSKQLDGEFTIENNKGTRSVLKFAV